MLNNAGCIYNELHYIYKNKKINTLDTKNRIKLDYKKLRLADIYDYLSDEEQEEKQKEEQEEEQKETITDANEINKSVNKQETDINTELFKKHFKFQRPSDMLKSLHKANTNQNNELVSIIDSGLKDLKGEIKKMSEEERKIEKPYNIVKIVEEILNFNKQQQEGH